MDINAHNIEWEKLLEGEISGSIAIVGSEVYVGTTKGFLYKLSRTDGRVLWKIPLPHAMYAAPAKVENLLYVGDMNSVLYLIDTTTGKIFWQGQYGKKGIRSDLVATEDTLYVGTEDGVLYALEK
jgi:outer membrane protein assembly factor BamB